jgi:spore germination protein KC
MRRTSGLLILMLGMTLIVTSCWDRHELNQIAIAVGIGMDKTEDGVRVTIQIVNPGEVASNKSGAGFSPPISVFSATEATTLEAIRKLTTAVPRQIFSSHLRIMIIGEELAREGIAEILDGVTRSFEIRSNFYLIVAKETTAKNVISILAPVEKIPANRMFTTLEMSEKMWAPTTTVLLDQLLTDISNPTKEAVLTGIELIGDIETGKTLKNLERSEPTTNFRYSGVALFKKDMLVDWFNEEESKGYNYIMDNVDRTIAHIHCPKGGKLGLEIMRSQSRIKGMITHGKPKIHINLHLEGNISEVQCKIDLTDEGTIHKLEKIAEKQLLRITALAVRKAKENQADVFGFGLAIEDAHPKAWVKLKDNWDQQFADLDVSFHIDVKIRKLGTINNSIVE